jgi:hypothetical protein
MIGLVITGTAVPLVAGKHGKPITRVAVQGRVSRRDLGIAALGNLVRCLRFRAMPACCT